MLWEFDRNKTLHLEYASNESQAILIKLILLFRAAIMTINASFWSNNFISSVNHSIESESINCWISESIWE